MFPYNDIGEEQRSVMSLAWLKYARFAIQLYERK